MKRLFRVPMRYLGNLASWGKLLPAVAGRGIRHAPAQGVRFRMRLFTKSIITIVSCSLAQIACAEEWRPFSVETPPGLEIQIVAEGVVKIDQDRVWFRVESAKLSRPKGVTRETEALAVYIGLAYPLRPPKHDGDTVGYFGAPSAYFAGKSHLPR